MALAQPSSGNVIVYTNAELSLTNEGSFVEFGSLNSLYNKNQLFEKAWFTEAKRKAFNDAYNIYFAGAHSDEICQVWD